MFNRIISPGQDFLQHKDPNGSAQRPNAMAPRTLEWHEAHGTVANSNQYRFNNEFIGNQKLLTLHSIASFDLQLSVAPRPHGEPPQSG